jgi:uncharacterized NAD(P)/FAD-binding protein YdhS
MTKSLTKVAIVGGGLTGIAILAGLVRAAIDRHVQLSITIFEPEAIIGTGLAYDTNLPDNFTLNHELGSMGSVNAGLRNLDKRDFFSWIQENRKKLQPLYPSYALNNPLAHVPRSLFGRYLLARYEAAKQYAADHAIIVHEYHASVDDIQRNEGEFSLKTADGHFLSDIVILATGNYFNCLDPALRQSGKCFHSFEYSGYMANSLPDNAIMLISGTGLSAYDAAIHGLESGKYRKVIMASRRGMLRRVRGQLEPYERKYFSIPNLEKLAGGSTRPFRLEHILRLATNELESAYGKQINLQERYSVKEIVVMLQSDIITTQNMKQSVWRSMLNSIPDDERQEIYLRLDPVDKEIFANTYSSLYQLINAPMPLGTAAKLLNFIETQRLYLVNGMQSVRYLPQEQKFELWYAHDSSGRPIALHDKALQSNAHAYMLKADVYIDGVGIGRSIMHVPLYRNILRHGLVEAHPLGGIRVDLTSRHVIDQMGKQVSNLYAIGQMTCGETILTHNSLQLSQLGILVGANIVQDIEARLRQQGTEQE